MGTNSEARSPAQVGVPKMLRKDGVGKGLLLKVWSVSNFWWTATFYLFDEEREAIWRPAACFWIRLLEKLNDLL